MTTLSNVVERSSDIGSWAPICGLSFDDRAPDPVEWRAMSSVPTAHDIVTIIIS